MSSFLAFSFLHISLEIHSIIRHPLDRKIRQTNGLAIFQCAAAASFFLLHYLMQCDPVDVTSEGTKMLKPICNWPNRFGLCVYHFSVDDTRSNTCSRHEAVTNFTPKLWIIIIFEISFIDGIFWYLHKPTATSFRYNRFLFLTEIEA